VGEWRASETWDARWAVLLGEVSRDWGADEGSRERRGMVWVGLLWAQWWIFAV